LRNGKLQRNFSSCPPTSSLMGLSPFLKLPKTSPQFGNKKSPNLGSFQPLPELTPTLPNLFLPNPN